jgi:SNF2 family DNA or RNA helicase
MEIIDNVALKLRAPASVMTSVKRNVQRSEVVNGELVVYWDFPEASLLAQALDNEQPNPNLPDVPSPMVRDYNWPGLYTPFQHQKVTASFLSLRRRAFCFNEAGTGKTSAAIWAADYLMHLGKVKRVLVICPLSIMFSAWQADVFNTAMHRTCAVAHGTSEKRRKVIAGDYDFVVINYDGVHVISEDLFAANFDLIIVDEANSYKNPKTKRWRTLAKLITPATRLWMMTGTPASQSPVDAFGLAKMISPWRVPKYITAWRDRVLIPVSKFKWVPKASAKNDVFYALQPAIRYTKAECLDLPEVVYQTRDVPLTTQAANYYKKLKSQMLIEAAGEQISAVNAAASLTKLLQLSGGAVYTDDHNVVEFDVSPRLSALQEVLDETVNKTIVFVPFLHTIEVVRRFVESIGHSTAVISGGVTATARKEIISQFQLNKDPHVLIIQPQSASHGVTLTAADTVVFWSPVMSVETYMQCIARIDRVGQKNSMTVVHLQGSDTERKIYAMLMGKVDSHQRLVDLYKQELGL